MRPNFTLLVATLLGLLLSSGVFFNVVHATNYVGNDDGEWDTCTTYGTCRLVNGFSNIEMYMGCYGTSCSNLTYSSNTTPTSLQYNPDGDISRGYQTTDSSGYPMWFQAAILAQGSNNCIQFTVQIYDTNGDTIGPGGIVLPGSSSPQFWTTGCYTVAGAFLYSTSTNNGAVWYISESTDSNGYVSDVCFYVIGGGYSGGGSTGTVCENPISYYSVHNYWLRPNLCLCGVNNGSTNYTGGTGTIYIASSTNMYVISPPVDIMTAENSNMEYGCFSGSGTNEPYQNFGLSGAC